MFNKKVKELESRINKLEEYIETQKDIEWSKENPEGKITIMCDHWIYLYARGKRGVIIGNIRDIYFPSIIDFKRLNSGNIKVTIKYLHEFNRMDAKAESSYVIDAYKQEYVEVEHINHGYYRQEERVRPCTI